MRTKPKEARFRDGRGACYVTFPKRTSNHFWGGSRTFVFFSFQNKTPTFSMPRFNTRYDINIVIRKK